MTDRNAPPEHPQVDPGRRHPQNAFDAGDGYSGQEYRPEREAAEAAQQNAAVAPRPVVDDPAADLPPDAGQRAGFDRTTGEVHGSGAGAGGGNLGEDFDAGSHGGGGYPMTGSEGDRSSS